MVVIDVIGEIVVIDITVVIRVIVDNLLLLCVHIWFGIFVVTISVTVDVIAFLLMLPLICMLQCNIGVAIEVYMRVVNVVVCGGYGFQYS